MDKRVQELEEEIASLKERNARVEADKAWETSGARIFSLTVITYVIAALVLYFIGAKNFLLSAVIPAVGFYLSVQTLPAIKKWWIKKFF